MKHRPYIFFMRKLNCLILIRLDLNRIIFWYNKTTKLLILCCYRSNEIRSLFREQNSKEENQNGVNAKRQLLGKEIYMFLYLAWK